ncbi:permease-like cell division protein FtsX [soil metagenome]
MQLRHVSTNLRQGLRRNLSMHLAVVLTLVVSLTLAGIGLMLTKETNLIVNKLDDQLKLSIYFCAPNDPSNASCLGEVTEEQKKAVEKAVADNAETESYYFEGKQVAFDRAKEVMGADLLEGPNAVVTVDDFQQTLWVVLKDPAQDEGVISAVEELDGVSRVQPAKELVGKIFSLIDRLTYGSWGAAGALMLAAILLVGNTIRLAALARRREIEIMRLVGASRWFIALPFLLESLVTAAFGVALSAGGLAAFTKFVIISGFDDYTDALPFVGWPEYWQTMIVVAIAGPVLTVLPTLLMTRKYLRS